MTTASAAARYLRDADRLTVRGDAPPRAVPFDLTAILGVRSNTNPATIGVQRIEVAEHDDQVWLRVWTRDPEAADLSDWGAVPVEAIYADAPDSARACAYRATVDLGHAVVQFQVNVVEGVTVVAAYTRFTDGSGRRPYFSREYLCEPGGQS